MCSGYHRSSQREVISSVVQFDGTSAGVRRFFCNPRETRRSVMADPRAPDPRNVDPTAPHAPYSDPAADPLLTDHRPVTRGGSRGGLIAAGVIAVLLVVALIAFSSGTTTDPGTTA